MSLKQLSENEVWVILAGALNPPATYDPKAIAATVSFVSKLVSEKNRLEGAQLGEIAAAGAARALMKHSLYPPSKEALSKLGSYLRNRLPGWFQFSPALRQALIEQMPPGEHSGALSVLSLFAFIDAAGSHIEKEGGKALNLASFRTLVLSNISKKRPLEQAISGVLPLEELPELLRESIGSMQENIVIFRENYAFRNSCLSCEMHTSVSSYLSSLPEPFREGALSLLGGYLNPGELGKIRELAGRAAPSRASFFSSREKPSRIEDFGKDAGFPNIGCGFLFSDSYPPWIICIPRDFVGMYIVPLGLKEGRTATTLARQEGIRELLVGLFEAIENYTSIIMYGAEKGVCRVEKVVFEARVDGLDIEVFPQESRGSGFRPLFLGGLELLGFLSPLCLSLKLGVPKGLLNDIIVAEMAPIRDMVTEEHVLGFFLALAYSGSASISIPKSKKYSLSYLVSEMEKQGLVSVEHKGEMLHLSPAGRLKKVSGIVRKLGEKGVIDNR